MHYHHTWAWAAGGCHCLFVKLPGSGRSGEACTHHVEEPGNAAAGTESQQPLHMGCSTKQHHRHVGRPQSSATQGWHCYAGHDVKDLQRMKCAGVHAPLWRRLHTMVCWDSSAAALITISSGVTRFCSGVRLLDTLLCSPFAQPSEQLCSRFAIILLASSLCCCRSLALSRLICAFLGKVIVEIRVQLLLA
jgi:hypothetical protein